METGLGRYTFTYDAARNLVGKQDAKGQLTTFGYDELNRRTDEWQHLAEVPRLGSRSEVAGYQRTEVPDQAFTAGTLHWEARYDASGNPTTLVEPTGNTRVSTYGALDRVETTTYAMQERRSR